MERISSEAMLRFVERLEREDVCLHGFELRQDGEIRRRAIMRPLPRGNPIGCIPSARAWWRWPWDCFWGRGGCA